MGVSRLTARGGLGDKVQNYTRGWNPFQQKHTKVCVTLCLECTTLPFQRQAGCVMPIYLLLLIMPVYAHLLLEPNKEYNTEIQNPNRCTDWRKDILLLQLLSLSPCVRNILVSSEMLLVSAAAGAAGWHSFVFPFNRYTWTLTFNSKNTALHCENHKLTAADEKFFKRHSRASAVSSAW